VIFALHLFLIILPKSRPLLPRKKALAGFPVKINLDGTCLTPRHINLNTPAYHWLLLAMYIVHGSYTHSHISLSLPLTYNEKRQNSTDAGPLDSNEAQQTYCCIQAKGCRRNTGCCQPAARGHYVPAITHNGGIEADTGDRQGKKQGIICRKEHITLLLHTPTTLEEPL
jgi:hypothetical protein